MTIIFSFLISFSWKWKFQNLKPEAFCKANILATIKCYIYDDNGCFSRNNVLINSTYSKKYVFGRVESSCEYSCCVRFVPVTDYPAGKPRYGALCNLCFIIVLTARNCVCNDEVDRAFCWSAHLNKSNYNSWSTHIQKYVTIFITWNKCSGSFNIHYLY